MNLNTQKAQELADDVLRSVQLVQEAERRAADSLRSSKQDNFIKMGMDGIYKEYSETYTNLIIPRLKKRAIHKAEKLKNYLTINFEVS